jgi:amino acid permease
MERCLQFGSGAKPTDSKGASSRTATVEHHESPSDAPNDDSGLKRQIPLGELIFLALSGSIGAGLFVASGSALSSGGPANVVINYSITGVLVILTMGALGELCSMCFLLRLPASSSCVFLRFPSASFLCHQPVFGDWLGTD